MAPEIKVTLAYNSFRYLKYQCANLQVSSSCSFWVHLETKVKYKTYKQTRSRYIQTNKLKHDPNKQTQTRFKQTKTNAIWTNKQKNTNKQTTNKETLLGFVMWLFRQFTHPFDIRQCTLISVQDLYQDVSLPYFCCVLPPKDILYIYFEMVRILFPNLTFFFKFFAFHHFQILS